MIVKTPSFIPVTLKKYKNRLEKALEKNLEKDFGEKTALQEACKYALIGQGKRIRPLIVLSIAESLGTQTDVMDAALSIEYFHTASLIADDMPCMDNDDIRRSKPALHKKFGETIALLATYVLISGGYEKIYHCTEAMKTKGGEIGKNADAVCVIALNHASRCAGAQGATGGQFLDLFPPRIDLEMLKQIIYKKTVTSFEVAFLFGWLFGGGSFSQIENVKKLAYHFGMAFQIADDIADMKQDIDEKSNIAHFLGKEKALQLYQEEMNQFDQLRQQLEIRSKAIDEMQALIRHHFL